MKLGKCDFFSQDAETLESRKTHLASVLFDFGFSMQEVSEIMLAYDYFIDNPTQFDGASIVKDLDTINGLDAAAMVHDYDYILGYFWSIRGLVRKIKNDWKYAQFQERTGKGSITPYTRAILLIISTPLYYLFFQVKKLKFSKNRFKNYSENHPNQ